METENKTDYLNTMPADWVIEYTTECHNCNKSISADELKISQLYLCCHCKKFIYFGASYKLKLLRRSFYKIKSVRLAVVVIVWILSILLARKLNIDDNWSLIGLLVVYFLFDKLYGPLKNEAKMLMEKIEHQQYWNDNGCEEQRIREEKSLTNLLKHPIAQGIKLKQDTKKMQMNISASFSGALIVSLLWIIVSFMGGILTYAAIAIFLKSLISFTLWSIGKILFCLFVIFLSLATWLWLLNSIIEEATGHIIFLDAQSIVWTRKRFGIPSVQAKITKETSDLERKTFCEKLPVNPIWLEKVIELFWSNY